MLHVFPFPFWCSPLAHWVLDLNMRWAPSDWSGKEDVTLMKSISRGFGHIVILVPSSIGHGRERAIGRSLMNYIEAWLLPDDHRSSCHHHCHTHRHSYLPRQTCQQSDWGAIASRVTEGLAMYDFEGSVVVSIKCCRTWLAPSVRSWLRWWSLF